MSHTTTVKSVIIKDLNALEQAVHSINKLEGMSLSFRRNGKVRLWSESRDVAASIDIPGVGQGLNVGFEGNQKIGYTPIFDAHGGWIAEYLGAGQHIAKTTEEKNLSNIGKLMQAYAAEVVRGEAMDLGLLVEEDFDPETGQVVLNIA